MKQCVICSKEYEPGKSWGVCCSYECTKERNKHVARWKRKYKKLHEPSKPRRKKKQSLADINKEARAAGMTYGEYIARIEGGMR